MRLLILLFSLTLAASHAQAQMENELLLQNMPPGYKIGFQTKQGNLVMTEFVPENESVENSTETLVTLVFLGLTQPTPNEFRQVVQESFEQTCVGAQFADVAQATENGYPIEVWIQDCPKNQKTGKPERIWFKAIKGNDSFYLIQKSFNFHPEPEQVVRWMQYLRSVQVCDTRLADRSCNQRRQ